MIITDLTRRRLAYERFKKQALADGFEMIHESGAPLWELARGPRSNGLHRIVDAQIAPDGQSVWIKIVEQRLKVGPRTAEAAAQASFEDACAS